LGKHTEIKESQRKTLNYFFIGAFIAVIIFFAVSLVEVNERNPNIGTNSTDLTQINAQSVPTIINGVTTSTSIIIAFSGTVIGIMIRDFLQDNKAAKYSLLIFFGIPLVTSATFLFSTYYQLTFAGIDSLKTAWKYSLSGLVSAFFVLFFVFLFFIFVQINPKRKRIETTIPQPQTQSPTEWKITIRNEDKMLEATGMDRDTVDKILQSWNANINPANPKEKKASDGKT
jgi:hypothetical protein